MTPESRYGSDMLTTTNPFETTAHMLDGIRRWVEIETPTEAPAEVNRLADLPDRV